MPRRIPRPPAETFLWPGRNYMQDSHAPHPLGLQRDLKMLQNIKRDMPKEYQIIKDGSLKKEAIISREPEEKTAEFFDALERVDQAAIRGTLERRQLMSDVNPHWQEHMDQKIKNFVNSTKQEKMERFKRVVTALQLADYGGYAPSLVAVPTAYYATTDQTKTTPRAPKKTTRKKK